MVFQNYALYPHMSVFENMAFGLKLRRFPREEIESRVKDAARILGITELLERKPKALSGGQRQRVAVQSYRASCRFTKSKTSKAKT
jgi:multiple sugar transport system ATP-binding protein